MKAVSERNAKDALSAIKKPVDDNLDARVLTKLLIHRLRVVLLLRYAPDLAVAFSKELTEADLVLAKEISKNPGVTSETLRMILEAFGNMAYAAVSHLPLELAVIDICGKE